MKQVKFQTIFNFYDQLNDNQLKEVGEIGPQTFICLRK